MKTTTIVLSLSIGAALLLGPSSAVKESQGAALVRESPPPLVLSDDGGWCWFEGPRALIHRGKLIVGTVAAGRHDQSRRGDIEAIIWDLSSGAISRTTLHDQLQLDDHDSPAFLVRPDGRFLTVYAKHNPESHFYFRISEPDDPTRWGPVEWFTPSPSTRLTYSNLVRLSAENNRIYNFFRGLDGRMKPSYVISDDGGQTWSVGGVVVDSPAVRPYVNYATDGVGTIHLVYTEGHPRDYANSLYHVVVRRGMLLRSDGTPIRPLSEGLRHPNEGTRIFQGDADHVAWPCAVELDAQGHPRVAYSVQVGSAGLPSGRGGDGLRYRHARWDGKRWHDHPLAHAGTRLYAGEDDYSGLVALDPDHPDVVYLSANSDPSRGTPLISVADGKRHHEIFRGTAGDEGATWTWTPITHDSNTDQLRPIIPRRAGGPTALLWLRGAYRAYTDYDLEVVGLLLK